MKDDGRRVAGGWTIDADLIPELHPGLGEDGASISTGQGELVLLIVGQQLTPY